LPEPIKEKYNIDPLVGEGQYLRMERGRKWADTVDTEVIISCRADIEDRTGFNSAFNGPTFTFYVGIQNIDFPITEFDEKNLYILGKNHFDEEWLIIKQYSAEETYQIWKEGKNIMWTYEGQMNYLSHVNEMRGYLLYSNSIYKGESYAGLMKADFILFDQVKLVITINKGAIGEQEAEFIFELGQVQSTTQERDPGHFYTFAKP
jgi:hypothetical protein